MGCLLHFAPEWGEELGFLEVGPERSTGHDQLANGGRWRRRRCETLNIYELMMKEELTGNERLIRSRGQPNGLQFVFMGIKIANGKTNRS